FVFVELVQVCHDAVFFLCGVGGVYFFFSSRRRHTRSKRDWSSDVCSSDLYLILFFVYWVKHNEHLTTVHFRSLPNSCDIFTFFKIGRASCRERLGISGGGEG